MIIKIEIEDKISVRDGYRISSYLLHDYFAMNHLVYEGILIKARITQISKAGNIFIKVTKTEDK